MQILVVGAGAMGCLFAARLHRAGFQVVVYEKIRPLSETIHEHGIQVQGIGGHDTMMVPAFSENPPFQADVVLLCVKSTDTREAAQTVSPWVRAESMVLTLQNGLGNVEILQEIFGPEKVLGGVTAEGATVLGPGKIRHAGKGETVIGPAREGDDRLPTLLSAFKQAGFQIRSALDVDQLLWGKLIINVGINALAAVTRLKNGRLPQIEATRTVMEQAVEEAVAVAKAKGVELPYPDPFDRVVAVCRATADNVASMLQDVLHEKTTEIDFINGAIVREGRALGIETPVNGVLTALVRTLQETYGENVGVLARGTTPP
jgi:2-dehydropantoate 2-reductase